MFKGEAGAAHVDLVDVNLEGGENRVDVDLFAEPDDEARGPGPGVHQRRAQGAVEPVPRPISTSCSMSPSAARTKSRRASSIRCRARRRRRRSNRRRSIARRRHARARRSATRCRRREQTAELSLDDLGLDVDALDSFRLAGRHDFAGEGCDRRRPGAVARRRDDAARAVARQFRSHDEGAASRSSTSRRPARSTSTRSTSLAATPSSSRGWKTTPPRK